MGLMVWIGSIVGAFKILFTGLLFFVLTLLVVFAYVEQKLIRERHKVEELRATKRKMIADLEQKLTALQTAKDQDHQHLVARIEQLEAKLSRGQ